jgi:hypothetical protein
MTISSGYFLGALCTSMNWLRFHIASKQKPPAADEQSSASLHRHSPRSSHSHTVQKHPASISPSIGNSIRFKIKARRRGKSLPVDCVGRDKVEVSRRAHTVPLVAWPPRHEPISGLTMNVESERCPSTQCNYNAFVFPLQENPFFYSGLIRPGACRPQAGCDDRDERLEKT